MAQQHWGSKTGFSETGLALEKLPSMLLKKRVLLLDQCGRTCIKVSHPYGPAPLAGRRALQKPYIAGSCSLRNNQLKAKLLRPFGQQSDLLLAMLGFVVFGAFVDVLLSVFDKPVEQTG